MTVVKCVKMQKRSKKVELNKGSKDLFDSDYIYVCLCV